MNYPEKVSITVFKENGEQLQESVFNRTTYDENSRTGVTVFEKGEHFNESYTMWLVKVSYDGKTEPVWSQPSPYYRAVISGKNRIVCVSVGRFVGCFYHWFVFKIGQD